MQSPTFCKAAVTWLDFLNDRAIFTSLFTLHATTAFVEIHPRFIRLFFSDNSLWGAILIHRANITAIAFIGSNHRSFHIVPPINSKNLLQLHHRNRNYHQRTRRIRRNAQSGHRTP